MGIRILFSIGVLASAGAVAGELFLEFEDAAVPEGIAAKQSTVSVDTVRRFRGEQSLKWDWQSGAVLQIDRTVECRPELNRREEGFQKTRTFKFWIYNEVPMPGKQLNIVFGDEQGEPCSFPYNLDFSGWRSAWVSYERDMVGAPDRDLSFIRFEAPAEGAGTFWIDDLAPSLSIDIRWQAPDHQVPFVNAGLQDLLLAPPHTPNILIDAEVRPLGVGFELTEDHRAAFREIESKLRATYPPVKKSAEALITNFNSYRIVKDEAGVIRGDFLPHLSSKAHKEGFPKRYQPEIMALSKMHDFRSYTELMLDMARLYQVEQTDELKSAFLLMGEHLLDQGWQAGSVQGTVHHFGYTSRAWPPAVFLMRDELAEAGMLEPMADALVWFFNVKKHFLPPSPHLGDMDYLNTTVFSELLAIASLPDSKEKVLYFEAFKNSFGRILALESPGLQGGIKTDGSLFHHGMHYAGYGVPGIKGATELINVLDGTHYELPAAAYNTIKKAYLSARLWGYPYAGFNACGRHPLLYGSEGLAASMRVLAKAAPETDAVDAELAAAYLGMEGGDAVALFGQPIEPDVPQGAWSMNYHSGLIYKHGNSSVQIKGFGSGVRSHETYGTDNRYGSYGSHGSIQIFQNNRAHNSGFEHGGWGWSQPPGATTLILPLDVLEQDDGFYGRSVPQSAPFGGASHLEHKIGLFAFQLDPDPKKNHAEALSVRKSVLAIDGRLICLGSGLSGKAGYPLVTTIFQCGLRDGHDAVQRGENWIIDPYGTGHWIAPGTALKQQTGRQESRHNKTKQPTEGDFSMAWIDHGAGARDASYEYVSVLEADAAIMNAMASNEFYSVKRQDDRTHAVLVPSEKLWALVNFQALEDPVGPFISISQPSLVLLKQLTGSTLHISVTDPRLELSSRKTAAPVEVVLEMKGRFKLAKPVAGISAHVQGSSTVITVRCAEGEPSQFFLQTS
ncbi:chondroitinase family polysaccharide lyase [Pontiellaceae bacterium B12227]|nr:chondroitinase family polysaccharide lyase [Pontiellaceae bacterium B12227]